MSQSVTAWLANGSLAPGQGGYTLVIHQDWSALVTPRNPALPSEIVHIYGFGFGPVNSHPPDGMPAPANPLYHTIMPITCSAWDADNVTLLNVPVRFSGLAPGLVGYYQLDAQIPPSNLRPDTELLCQDPGSMNGLVGDIPVRPTTLPPPAKKRPNGSR